MSILKRIFRKSNKKATTMENTPNQEVKTDLINEEKKTMEETKEDLKQKPEGKNRIYNLIIVDESGSMHSLRDATLSGINETINTIKGAQKEHVEKQDHYLTLVTFDDRRGSYPTVRTIIDAQPINEVADFEDYNPWGGTPLYDAMGTSLSTLHKKIQNDEDAVGVVTVLTDGLENSSKEWDASRLRQLIEQLKEEGWSFSYMGSNHNVKGVSDLLAIDNVVEFSHDQMGVNSTWGRERSSKGAYFDKLASAFDSKLSKEEKKRQRRKFAKEYYADRVSPWMIVQLQPDEIFVFGSNVNGAHAGGAARTALEKFGAIWGQGEGLQGQSYAIPTMEGLDSMEAAINRFIEFAELHQEYKFLVTPIGCGIAGYSPIDIAPLFRHAVHLENVCLPESFWDVLGIKMNL